MPPSEQEMYMGLPPGAENDEQHWYDWLREKKNKANIINILTKVANRLDQKKFYNEADELDEIINRI